MLWKPKLRLANVKVAQAFAFDGPTMYALQVSVGGERAGNLTVSRLSSAGKITGRMWLRGFGHGVALGVDPGGWLWVECGPVTRIKGSARGSRITRVKFVDGKTVRGKGTLALDTPGNRCSPSIDVANDVLCIRAWESGAYRFRTYSLSAAREGKLVPLSGPVRLGISGVFQGHQIDGGRVLCVIGAKGLSPTVAAISLATGKTSILARIPKTPGYFEAEGITVRNGRPIVGAAVGRIGARRLQLHQL